MSNQATDRREWIARRIASEFKAGDVVNLGIGLPTLVARYLPREVAIALHSENGFIGLGPPPSPAEEDPDLINAGGAPASILPGGCFFDTATSFAIIRGGHLDATVLGALQVDQYGNLANWMIPGKFVPGIGGAMDLATGARRVIVATEHRTKYGESKVVRRCNLPLTGAGVVDLIVTDLCVLEVAPGGRPLIVRQLAPGVTEEEVRAATAAELDWHLLKTPAERRQAL